MLNINGKKLCGNCFNPIKNEPCPYCGYKKSAYRPEPGALPVESVLMGRYSVGEVLGKGGFGVTYKAYDIRNDRIVAVKEYYPNGLVHRDTGTTQISVSSSRYEENFRSGADKFYDEAKTVARFNGNPNIVNVYEFFYENSTVYYSMEFLDGVDLKHYVKSQGGRIPQENALYIMNVITDALLIAHSMNVLHRDISPDNIFVTKDGGIKLIDFGAARQVLAEQSKSLSVILKQGFAPLEQYQRRGKQGPWTDIYALGATVFYILTGKLPDEATERLDYPDIGKASDYGVDEGFWGIIQKCMEIRIADRYQSVHQLKEALNGLEIKPAPIVTDGGSTADICAAEPAPAGRENTAVSTSAAGTVSEELGDNNAAGRKKRGGLLLFLRSSKGKIITGAAVVVLVLGAVLGAVLAKAAKQRTVGSGDIKRETAALVADNDTTAESENSGNEATGEAQIQPRPDPDDSGEDRTTERGQESGDSTRPYESEDTPQSSAEEHTEAPAQKPTEKPVDSPPEKPTEKATHKPAEKPTEKPTEVPKPTEKATQKPTEKPAQKPTEAPKPTTPVYSGPAPVVKSCGGGMVEALRGLRSFTTNYPDHLTVTADGRQISLSLLTRADYTDDGSEYPYKYTVNFDSIGADSCTVRVALPDGRADEITLVKPTTSPSGGVSMQTSGKNLIITSDDFDGVTVKVDGNVISHDKFTSTAPGKYTLDFGQFGTGTHTYNINYKSNNLSGSITV